MSGVDDGNAQTIQLLVVAVYDDASFEGVFEIYCQEAHSQLSVEAFETDIVVGILRSNDSLWRLNRLH